MLITLFPMVTEVSEAHPQNTCLPMLVTLSPMVTEVSEVQL